VPASQPSVESMKTVELEQGRLTYRVAGPEQSSYPPVVFVHGLLVNNSLWASVADLLAQQGVRSYAPNWPLGSHRYPMSADADLSPPGLADIINGFLAALDLVDVTLVGSDTGGGLCQFVIDSDSSRIGRLVLANCDAFERFPPPEFELVVKLGQHPPLLWLLVNALKLRPLRQSDRGYGLVFSGTPDATITDEWIEPARRHARIRRDTAKVMRGIRPQASLDVASRLGAFTKPVHLVWGDRDVFFPMDVAERLVAAFPDATLTTIEGGRTFVSMDFPEPVATVIAQASGLDHA
jgi:pimeloyl-ACP methyl ester carboxylesterase